MSRFFFSFRRRRRRWILQKQTFVDSHVVRLNRCEWSKKRVMRCDTGNFTTQPHTALTNKMILHKEQKLHLSGIRCFMSNEPFVKYFLEMSHRQRLKWFTNTSYSFYLIIIFFCDFSRVSIKQLNAKIEWLNSIDEECFGLVCLLHPPVVIDIMALITFRYFLWLFSLSILLIWLHFSFYRVGIELNSIELVNARVVRGWFIE